MLIYTYDMFLRSASCVETKGRIPKVPCLCEYTECGQRMLFQLTFNSGAKA